VLPFLHLKKFSTMYVYVHIPTFIHRSHGSRRNREVRVRSAVAGRSRNVGPQHAALLSATILALTIEEAFPTFSQNLWAPTNKCVYT
jgi:hypothetical protein